MFLTYELIILITAINYFDLTLYNNYKKINFYNRENKKNL